MPGPYPLATLSAKVTPTGITAPVYNDILQSLIASMQAIFGSDIYITPDTQDYQMLAIFAAAINDQNQAMIATYNNFAPSFAQGAGLSALVKINGLLRESAVNSTAQLVLVGVAGTVILAGQAQDTNGNLWSLPLDTVIPNSGTVTVTATCDTSGAIAAPANTINQINTVILGWQTVNNPSAATIGTSAETDSALRQRQSVSTAIASETPLAAILAAIANVPGVTRYAIYENPTGVTDGNGVPPHSISLVVQGGDVNAVATTIEEKKSPGTGTYGTTNITVNDPAGVPITINFFELANINIYIAISIHPLAGYVSTTGTALVNALVAFINGLAIGQTLYYDWLFGPAALYGNPLGQTYKINSLFVGLSASPTGTADVPIAFNQAATSVSANIVLTVA